MPVYLNQRSFLPDVSFSLPPPCVFYSRLWGRGGRWDLPALCWSCCASRCPRVWRWSLRGAQVGVLLDSLWNLRLQLQSAFMHAALSSISLNFTVAPERHWRSHWCNWKSLLIVIVDILDSVLKMLFAKTASRGEGRTGTPFCSFNTSAAFCLLWMNEILLTEHRH